MLFIGTKGKMRADVYSDRARLLPYSRMDEVNIPKTLPRVPNQANGHYAAMHRIQSGAHQQDAATTMPQPATVL